MHQVRPAHDTSGSQGTVYIQNEWEQNNQSAESRITEQWFQWKK